MFEIEVNLLLTQETFQSFAVTVALKTSPDRPISSSCTLLVLLKRSRLNVVLGFVSLTFGVFPTV